MLFPWIMKRIPVEVALIYTSYTENIFSYVNNINTHEGGTHLQGFRTGLTRSLKECRAWNVG
jgi:DNA gyrase subunit B